MLNRAHANFGELRTREVQRKSFPDVGRIRPRNYLPLHIRYGHTSERGVLIDFTIMELTLFGVILLLVLVLLSLLIKR
jgi:hypothetical protein